MVFNRFFKSLSVDEEIQEKIKSEMIMDNVVGFVSTTGGAGSSTLVSNVGYILSKYNLIKKQNESLTDMVVCILDLNVINPVQYKLLGEETVDPQKSILDIFIKGTGGISSQLIRLSNTLSLVSSSPEDEVYDYFDVTADSINGLIEYLKEHFDIVLVDIPNQVASPLCYEAIRSCSKVFFVWDESINILQNTQRMVKFFEKIKIKNKFTHVIFNKKTRTSLVYEKIEELSKKVGLKLLAVIPYSQDIVNGNLEGHLYVEQGILRKEIKNPLMKICEEITHIKLSNIVSREDIHENVAN